jgi:hypothetical protein
MKIDFAPLQILNGWRSTQLPGKFLLEYSPKKVARGRESELLLLSLQLHKGGSAPAELESNALEQAYRTYFSTSRSVTAAARAALQVINNLLLQHNQESIHTQVTADCLCLVFRSNELYCVQAGPGSLYIWHNDRPLERQPHTQQAARTLGVATALDVRYAHTYLQVGDVLVLTQQPPKTWNEPALGALPSHDIPRFLQALGQLSDKNLNGFIAQLISEKDEPQLESQIVNLFSEQASPVIAEPQPTPKPQTVVEPPPLPPPTASVSNTNRLARVLERVRSTENDPASSTAARAAVIPVAPRPPSSPSEDSAADIFEWPDWVQQRANARQTAETAAPIAAVPAALKTESPNPEFDFDAETNDDTDLSVDPETEAPDLVAAAPPRRRAKRLADSNRQSLGTTLRNWFVALPLQTWRNQIWHAWQASQQSLWGGGQNLLDRLTPASAEASQPTAAQAPAGLQIAVVIAVPLLIAIIAGSIYVREGQSRQYSSALGKAQIAISQAKSVNDPATQLLYWQQALTSLQTADAIFQNQSSVLLLRTETQQALDRLEGVERLTGNWLNSADVPANASFGQLLWTDQALYAMDSNQPKVYRFAQNNQGTYQIDRDFQCGPGPIVNFELQKLVDLVWLPKFGPTQQPAVLALDSSGILLYCSPAGKAATALQLPTPSTGWQSPTAFTVYGDNLYVLDPAANQFWVYQGQASEGQLQLMPLVYFQSGADLSNSTDFTIDSNGKVYFLFQQGDVWECERNGGGGTNCQPHTNPTGRDPVFAQQIQFDPPPEPALYVLTAQNDGTASSVQQHSLRLLRQREYRIPWADLPRHTEITSFALGRDERLFLGVGREIFISK